MISIMRKEFCRDGLIVVAFAATMSCGLEVVTPANPPANIPSALLYLRPKESFWVVCKPKRPNLHACDFYNPNGTSVAFRCNYAFSEPPSQEMFRRAWLGEARELKLGSGTTVQCQTWEDAPSR